MNSPIIHKDNETDVYLSLSQLSAKYGIDRKTMSKKVKKILKKRKRGFFSPQEIKILTKELG